MNHHVWMFIACVLPMLLLFGLAAFGLNSPPLVLLLLVGCFVMHLFMMRRNDHKNGNGDDHANH